MSGGIEGAWTAHREAVAADEGFHDTHGFYGEELETERQKSWGRFIVACRSEELNPWALAMERQQAVDRTDMEAGS